MNYIPEGGVFLELKLPRAELMVSRYLMRRQYELGARLGKYEDEILDLLKIKTQHMTFDLGFKPTRKDLHAMVTQKEKKARQGNQTNHRCTDKNPSSIRDFPRSILHISAIAFRASKRGTWSSICRPKLPGAHLHNSNWFTGRISGSSRKRERWHLFIEKDLASLPSFPLAVSNHTIRK